jgi:asparagine synthase (glutamine-hydrolysing)
MCGLSGYLALERAGDRLDHTRILRAMNRKLAHRGPDAEGYFEAAPIYLGHRRLSVIDIAASIQPMSTADQRYTIVFNGEVYNFKTLRAELQALGHVFRTAGDTEVVLQAVAAWGENALKKLQGMFAFAGITSA